MPSKTFLNLPLEKQANLLNAAKREFAKNSFNMASINQIIRDAEIPRGSFYMYFVDKEDLYYYILNKYRMTLFERVKYHLKEQKGDFIKVWEILYDEIINYCTASENVDLFKNIFLNMHYATEKKMLLKPPIEEITRGQNELLILISKDLYQSSNDSELMDAFGLVMMITTTSIVYTFMNKEIAIGERTTFKRRLNIIKYGLYKESEN
ncbi:MAG: TetR/AcrR family transcriptional regulator [Bacilli bacterium]